MKKHIVSRGECIASIAFEAGHFWKTLWEHEANAALRARRSDGHVLLEGDEVWVPELREKTEEVATAKRHRFRRLGVPEKLRLRFGDDEFPRAGVPYRLIIDGREQRGRTDEKGEISHYLPPNARQGELVLEPKGAEEERYDLGLRCLDPVTEVTGVQMRLKNLSFYDGPVDGALHDATARALRDFQLSRRLAPTGEPDDPTRAALLSAHGC